MQSLSRFQSNIPFSKLTTAALTITACLSLLQSRQGAVRAFSTSPSSMSSAANASGAAAAAAAAAAGKRHPLAPLIRRWDFSWLDQLTDEADDQGDESSKSKSGHNNNKSSRQVFHGHYVRVEPTPLRNPRLIVHSKDVASMLCLSEEDVASDEFAKFFSGDVNVLPAEGRTKTWATPYALSIMGTKYTNNCPFGTGNGYGDGRAISIGEILVKGVDKEETPSDSTSDSENIGQRYEMQLKGAGKTPFCRGADGRAVLRSSIREFLASEAMHHLGISTTRALSLVLSDGPNGNTSQRPWYSEQVAGIGGQGGNAVPDINDPRLASFPLEKRRQLIAQLSKQKRDPDIMIEEPNAITCRVAPSFTRVGHVDLFARRAAAARGKKSNNKNDGESREWKELEEIIWHAAYREFYSEAYAPYKPTNDLKGCVRTLLERSADGIAAMVAGWVRVGFAQGNFNGDNCLIAGRTMDYGPFGFMDEYDPRFAKWTGSGDHFGFLNQPSAGFANFAVLVESTLEVLRGAGGYEEKQVDALEEEMIEYARGAFQREADAIWKAKLGFSPMHDGSASSEVWRSLEPLMRDSRVDWTVFWRRLTELATVYPVDRISSDEDDAEMLHLLLDEEDGKIGTSPFYEEPSSERRDKWMAWIQKWREALSTEAKNDSNQAPDAIMRRANPKYVLREWMLVEAYTKAARGDESMVKELLELIQHPYDEGGKEQSHKYHRRASDESLSEGGTAFMS